MRYYKVRQKYPFYLHFYSIPAYFHLNFPRQAASYRYHYKFKFSEGLDNFILKGYKGGRFVKKINADIIVNGLDLLIQTQRASFDELMEARKAIECITVKMAALNRSQENLAAMSKVLDLRVESKEEFYKKMFDLHEIVASASQNRILFYIVQAIRKLTDQTYSLISLEENDIDFVIKSHTAIYDCINNCDPAGAERAMINDIEAYRELYLSIVKKRNAYIECSE